jgi:hypothetical protein
MFRVQFQQVLKPGNGLLGPFGEFGKQQPG